MSTEQVLASVQKARQFAPLPMRALADGRLSALDLRMLAVIGWHGRLGKNKRGCYAGHKTLANELQCAFTSVSECVARLQKWEYIAVRPDDADHRRRSYFVVDYERESSAVAEPFSATNFGNGPEIVRQWPRNSSATAGRKCGQGLNIIGELAPNIFEDNKEKEASPFIKKEIGPKPGRREEQNEPPGRIIGDAFAAPSPQTRISAPAFLATVKAHQGCGLYYQREYDQLSRLVDSLSPSEQREARLLMESHVAAVVEGTGELRETG